MRNRDNKKTVVSLFCLRFNLLFINLAHNYKTFSLLKIAKFITVFPILLQNFKMTFIFFISADRPASPVFFCCCFQICIEGNIASGKTTCLEYFSRTSNIEVGQAKLTSL